MDFKRFIPYYLRAWRGIASYFLFVTVMALGALLFRTPESIVDPDIAQGIVPSVVRAVFIPFLFASITRVLCERDPILQDTLYSAADSPGSFRRILGNVLRSRFFWIEAGTVLLLGTILPASFGFYPLVHILFRNSTLEPLLQKLILLCIILPLFFLIELWQHVAAHYYWSEMERCGQLEQACRHAIPHICLIVGLYLFTFFALTYVFPVILTVYFAVWLLLIPVGTLLILIPAWRYTRALLIRGRFLKKLRQLCAKKGFSLSPIKRPYRSVFRNKSEHNFTLEANGQRYTCKMLSAVTYGTTMILSEGGTADIEHSFGLRQGSVRAMRFGLFGNGANFGGTTTGSMTGYHRQRRAELYRFTTHLDFSFEGEGTKILIVNPVPFEIMAGDPYKSRYIDNGDFVGDYLVFSASGLLGALERDCVERLAEEMKLQLKD